MIEQFLADDIHFMFGNPGTVEQGFLNSLEEYPDFKYIMGLQETIAVGMADGYARATKKPTVVQLHSGVGLGNGIGMMYQSMRGHAPLVVIAGEAGIKYDAMDAQMAADLVSMAKPVTKWATRVVDSRSLLRVLRRAIKIASTPPMGPVFVCVPADVMDAENDEPIFPTSILDTRVAPSADQIARAADMLVGAQHPMIIIGDGIAFSRAQDEAHACRRTAWRGSLGRGCFRSQHELQSPALERDAGAYVRAVQQQSHDQSRRGADRGHVCLPRSLPEFRRCVCAETPRLSTST